MDIQEPVGVLILNEEMMADYLMRSGRKDLSFEKLTSEIDEYREAGMVWDIVVDGVKEGIFWAKKVDEIHEGTVLVVGGLYIRPGSEDLSVLGQVDRALESYARELGVQKIVFYTKRDGEAFRRRLGGLWAIDSVVLSRAVK
jgi:hypothetical protein